MKNEMKMKKHCCLSFTKKIAALMISLLLVALIIPSYAFADSIENTEYTMSDRLRFVDLAGLIEEEEIGEIEEKLGEISTRQHMDVVIATVNSLEGKTATEYADDFYDECGYGYGEEGDGIILLVDMGEHKWALSTKGAAISVFTDAGQKYMTEQFIPYMSDGDYYDAFYTYADLCDDFITQAYEDRPYDEGNLPKTYFKFQWILYSLLIGFISSFILAMVKKSEMKSIVRQQSASGYTKEGSINMTNSHDRFINNIVTTRIISSDDSGGGSSTHTSSSGSTHGGSSGEF